MEYSALAIGLVGGLSFKGNAPMEDFVFQVKLIAVVRVRAADESVTREVVPTALGAPGSAELRLANQNNFATGRDASVTNVEFSIGSIKPLQKAD